jgi:hypothetical protein
MRRSFSVPTWASGGFRDAPAEAKYFQQYSTLTYQPEKVSQHAEGLMPRILLVPAPPGLCARERIFAHESVAFFRHTISPPLVHYTSIKVGVANGYICVALLKQICVIADPSAISPYPGHFWFVRRAAHRHTGRDDHNAD